MHFMTFGGLVPKVAPKALRNENGTVAENLDVYSTRFLPHKELGESVVLLDVHGGRFTGVPEVIHKVGNTFIAFTGWVSIAEDPIERLGKNSFLFVEGGKLWRQSEQRILQKLPPIQVGMERPACDVKPTAELVEDAGCETPCIGDVCGIEFGKDECHEKVPYLTAYKFTYVNGCEEESADSFPSEFIDFHDGDAIRVRANDKPPANAVKRRWYRAVPNQDYGVEWLFVGAQDINEQEFYDVACAEGLGASLETELDNPPPTCIEGIVNVGNNRTVLWGGNKIYVSNAMRPHAYPTANEYELRFNVLRLAAVTEKVEGGEHYQVLALTDGLHYRIVFTDTVGISELETRFDAIKREMTCTNEVAMYYIAKEGICEFTTGGIQLITGDYYTEREWSQWYDRNTRMVYHDGSLFFFRGRNFVYRLGADERRDASLTTLSTKWDMGWSNHRNKLLVYEKLPVGEPLCRWFGDGQERMCGVWRSKPIMMSGRWRPTTFKVVSPEFVTKSVYARRERGKYRDWLRLHPTLGVDEYIEAFPGKEQYRDELRRQYPYVEVVLFADGKEYYRRKVTSERPVLVPRKYRAIDWQVEVRSRLVVEEVHIQTSRESLLSEE